MQRDVPGVQIIVFFVSAIYIYAAESSHFLNTEGLQYLLQYCR